ncbi:ABC transporter permease [Paenarthrobacter sp. NPDC056912]|uniref:ABC transporter permease n=1 Tax=Paenarthrobacter sp. NPDC056912 TaxID=3345965 RepID=UPI00366E2AFA
MSAAALSTAGLQPAKRRIRSPWAGFILRRLVSFFVSLWFILTLVFFLVRAIGGDSIRAAAGIMATPEYIAAKREQFGLDDPILVQYGDFFQRIIHLDFGNSLSTGQPVISEIAVRFPYTAQLGGYSFLLAILLSVPLGMAMAVRTQDGRGSRGEAVFNAVTGFFAAVPDFLIAIGLILVFAVGLHLVPAAGGSGPVAFILPVITVSTGLVAVLSRLVKSETARVLKEEYVRTARANQLSPTVVLGRHVLPNVLTATLTFTGMVLASLLGGAIITETVFAWPGIGNLLVKAIQLYDFTLLEGLVVVISGFSLIILLLVDVLLVIVDPKSLMLRS